MVDFKKEFGKKVRAYRKEKNMNQEMFAERASISPQTLSGIETGSHFPSYPVLTRIIDALKTHPAKLFAYDDEVWNINDKELQFILVEAFKNLDFEKRKIVLKIVRCLAETE